MLEEEVYGANSPIWDVEFAQNAVHGSASNGAGQYPHSLMKNIVSVNSWKLSLILFHHCVQAVNLIMHHSVGFIIAPSDLPVYRKHCR